MRIVLLLATLTGALASLAAHADLYRWVDPQTGSVKFSSYPPPWLGHPARELNAPATEVIVYQAPGSPKPAAAPAKPPALPSNAAVGRGGLQQQIADYQALSAELDRLDPAGAARRRAQEAEVMETLRRGLEAQFGKK